MPLGIADVNNRANLSDLRNKLYDLLLTSSEQRPEAVQLDQKLGVSITKAAQRDGNVQIIQLQNANVYHITEKVVDALKLVDSIEQRISQNLAIAPSNLRLLCDSPSADAPLDCVVIPDDQEDESIEPSPEEKESDILRKFMDIMFIKNLDWKGMQRFVMSEYLKHVGISLKGNRTKMSKFLNVQRTYISRKIGDFKLTGVIDDDYSC